MHVDLHYTPAGAACSDFEVEAEYQRILARTAEVGGTLWVATASELVINRVRVGVKEGDITATITWDVSGQEPRTVKVSPDGTLNDWKDFPDVGLNLLTRLIG